MKQLTLALLGIALTACGIQAQEKTSQAPPAFEVASVKPSSPNPGSPLGMLPVAMPAPNGRFTATNTPALMATSSRTISNF